MAYLLIFIAGTAFVMIAVPLFDSLANLITTAINWLIVKMNVGIAEHQSYIEMLQEDDEPGESTNAIGFQSMPDIDWIIDDDEEDDE